VGAFDPGITPPAMNGAEPQLRQRRRKKNPKAWQRLRERGVVGIDGGAPGLTSAPVASTGMKQARAAARHTRVCLIEQKSLKPWKPHKPGKPWKKIPKVVPYKPGAYDGNSDGMVQDGTIHERPAGPKHPKFRFFPGSNQLKPPKPKPLPPWPPKDREKKKINWKAPMFGELLMERPGTTSYKLRKPDGRYIRPRRELHRKIIDHFLAKAGKPKPEGQRTIYFMGGGPSSLKSTALKSGITKIPEETLIIDTDEVKEFLPEYREWVEWGVGDAAALTQDESKHVNKLLSHELVDGGHDFVFDTTGNGNYQGFKERLEGLRTNGHRVVAHYMTNDIKTALELNHKRFLETGRKVPEYNVKHIHGQVSRNVPQALKEGLFDELYLYDTNDLDKGPRLILSAKDGRIKIHDLAAYKAFLEKGKLAEPPKPPPGVAVTKPGGVWQPKLGFSDGKPKLPSSGPFDGPPKTKPQLPPPVMPPPLKPKMPTDSSGKPIPPPPVMKPKDAK
jgi:predicted ABC-type ATPase